MLVHAATVKLLAADVEIKDRAIRRDLCELVDRIAKSVKKKSRR